MNNLKFSLLTESAKLPVRKHSTDAGIDVFSDEPDTTVPPNSFHIFKTGVAFDIPEGYIIQIWPKSRSNFLIGGGICDPLYKGEILVKVENTTNEPMLIKNGDPIAQLILIQVSTPILEQVPVEKLREIPSERGTTGGIVTQLETAKEKENRILKELEYG
jgi:dUTP pyrophosphatase